MSKRDIILGTAIVAVFPDKSFVVTRRSATRKTGAGMYALPGGHIERGEEIWYSAAKETLEETGLIVVPRRIHPGSYVFHTNERITDSYHAISLYVAADVVGGLLANREPDKHSEWERVSLRDNRPDLWDEGCSWVPMLVINEHREKIGL